MGILGDGSQFHYYHMTRMGQETNSHRSERDRNQFVGHIIICISSYAVTLNKRHYLYFDHNRSRCVVVFIPSFYSVLSALHVAQMPAMESGSDSALQCRLNDNDHCITLTELLSEF